MHLHVYANMPAGMHARTLPRAHMRTHARTQRHAHSYTVA
jgi:hypothetical protein